MAKLFIVRHGETDFNLQGRYAGSTNIELNNKGLRQAHEIARKVSKLNIDIIITSPLKRCIQTSSVISKILNVPQITMSEFRERNVGIYEALIKDEAKNKFPELWAKNITRIYDDAPPGGETIKEVENRVFGGLQELQAEYVDNNILIVTHGFVSKVIHKFFKHLTEEEFFNYKLDNGSIAEYQLSSLGI